MSITRAERRAEAAKRRSRIDPACPAELVRTVDVKIATTLAGKTLRFHPGESVATVIGREMPDIFATVEAQGFKLSFDADNSPNRLARGIVAYSIKRKALN